jgi:hypothetical protein
MIKTIVIAALAATLSACAGHIAAESEAEPVHAPLVGLWAKETTPSGPTQYVLFGADGVFERVVATADGPDYTTGRYTLSGDRVQLLPMAGCGEPAAFAWAMEGTVLRLDRMGFTPVSGFGPFGDARLVCE